MRESAFAAATSAAVVAVTAFFLWFALARGGHTQPLRGQYDVTARFSNAGDLPRGADARIAADALLGGAYVSIEPGGSFDSVKRDGAGEIRFTRAGVEPLTPFAAFASGGSGSPGMAAPPSRRTNDFADLFGA
jgi:phospholipid/cholesterol/gamma-HCH transport system substrate-binding protein